MDDDVPYRLAYEVSVHGIEDQARVLESLRTRAGTVFAATALVTSFAGGLAVTVADGSEEAAGDVGFWLPAGAIGIFALLALLTLAILWPYRMRFSVSAREMLAIVDERAAASPVSSREAYRELALRYEEMYDYNAQTVRALFWCFRAAIVCLVAEVAASVVLLGEIT